jgi:hypothetical protein
VRFLIELLSGIAVLLAAVPAGASVLQFAWALDNTNLVVLGRIPLLGEVVRRLPIRRVSLEPAINNVFDTFVWLAIVLFIVLLARNFLPTVRISPRGFLVEFAGSWLPIPWESLRQLRVTSNKASTRYVLLAETDPDRLTGWHRCYSLLYRLRLRPAFLITSSVSDFEALVKTMLEESDRSSQLFSNNPRAELNERSTSFLFATLLHFQGPLGETKMPAPTEEAPILAAEPVQVAAANITATYPRTWKQLAWAIGILLIALGIARYIFHWIQFLALLSPSLRLIAPFDRVPLLQGQLVAPWWILISAHVVLALLVGLGLLVISFLPDLEARQNGLAVKNRRGWELLPWPQIGRVQVTEIAPIGPLCLLTTRGTGSIIDSLRGALFDGKFAPGILVAPINAEFEQIVERAAGAAAYNRDQTGLAFEEADAALGKLVFQPTAYLSQRVETSRAELGASEVNRGLMLKAARPMGMIALLMALLAPFAYMFGQGLPPSQGPLLAFFVIFLLVLLEWPIVALICQLIDERTGGGEEGNRIFALYPESQLPRVLPLVVALVLAVLGAPLFPEVFWLVASFWSYTLSQRLLSALYNWEKSLLMVGSMIPVVFQLLVLLAYLILR